MERRGEERERREAEEEEREGTHITGSSSLCSLSKERMMIASTVVGSFECPICMDTSLRGAEVCYLGCGHRLCFDCASHFVASKVNEGQVSRETLRCPLPKCKRALSVAEVKGCLADAPEALSRYERFALKHYLESDTNTFFCPTAGCDFAAEVGGGEVHSQRFECPCCSEAFCLSCKAPWHKGLTCEEHKQSASVPQEERELATHALKMGMKQCPRCRFWVEKAEGCNAMLCRCGCTFCWRCGQDVNAGKGGCNCLKQINQFSGRERMDVLSVNAHATNPENPAHQHLQRHLQQQQHPHHHQLQHLPHLQHLPNQDLQRLQVLLLQQQQAFMGFEAHRMFRGGGGVGGRGRRRGRRGQASS